MRGGVRANPADLAALALDAIQRIASRIRTEDTSDWYQYSNADQYGRTVGPRPERVCRDALLSDIRSLLPNSISTQPERQHVNENRADFEF